VNEYETHLESLKDRSVGHSYFTLDNALLRKLWTLQDIVTNMEDCIKIVDQLLFCNNLMFLYCAVNKICYNSSGSMISLLLIF
jgi:hypothetical protein